MTPREEAETTARHGADFERDDALAENKRLRQELTEVKAQLDLVHRQVAEIAREVDPDVMPDTWGLRDAVMKMRTELETARPEVVRLTQRLDENERSLDQCRRITSEAADKAERLGFELRDERAARECAEQERDKVKADLLHERKEWRAAFDAVEADNAALLNMLEEASMGVARLSKEAERLPALRYKMEQYAGDIMRPVLAVRGAVKGERHPGAPLLERLRAAERLRPLAVHDEACSVDMGHPPDPERCALCAVRLRRPDGAQAMKALVLTLLLAAPAQKTAPCAEGEKESDGKCWLQREPGRCLPGGIACCPGGAQSVRDVRGRVMWCFVPVEVAK